VLGGGVVGTQAAKVAVGLGAEVTILDKSLGRLRELDDLFGGRVRTCYSTTDTLEAEARGADALIGAVLLPGASAPKLITRALLRQMKRGSVLVDVAIDQGGCAETSRPTTHADPTYIEEGVVHYCVANMPGAVPRTSTIALNNATLPIGLLLAERGLAALEDPHLAAGLNVHRGRLTNKAVADSLGLECGSFDASEAG
jgi:alanine dehydrogenase